MKLTELQEKTAGVVFGVLSAVFVAVYLTTNKYIYAHYDVSALEYSVIFALSGAVYGFPSMLAQLNANNRRAIRAHLKSLILLSVVGTVAISIFVIGSLYTTAVNASLLMCATIVATALFSHRLLRERHSKYQYIWMIVLFLGLYIGVVGVRSVSLHRGDLIVLGSVVFFGFGNAYSRMIMKRMGNARLVPDIRMSLGGIMALIAAPFLINEAATVLRILPLALVAGLFYWLCMKAFARAVYLVNANNAIILNNSQIFFTSLAGVIVLSESYSLEKLLGSIVAITAIYFIVGGEDFGKNATG